MGKKRLRKLEERVARLEGSTVSRNEPLIISLRNMIKDIDYTSDPSWRDAYVERSKWDNEKTTFMLQRDLDQYINGVQAQTLRYLKIHIEAILESLEKAEDSPILDSIYRKTFSGMV